MTESQQEIKRTDETLFFPFSPKRELERIKEILRGKETTVVPLNDAGYIIHNQRRVLTAEAPWILLDFDDTAAQTTRDKKRCWDDLNKMGLTEEVLEYCDEISRVDLGGEKIYQPELEMRLVSLALARKEENPKLDEPFKAILETARKELVKNPALLEKFPTDLQVEKIYEKSRYSSTLYQIQLELFKGLQETPNGPAILQFSLMETLNFN